MPTHTERGYRTPPIAIAVIGALTLSGCARYLRIQEKGMSCVDAHRAAIAAVRRLNYSVEKVNKPTPGVPGIVVASREELGQRREVVVQVFCTALGAEVEAKTDETGLAALMFKDDFQRSFQSAAAAPKPVRPAAESGLDVLLTRERGGGGLGVDLGAGLLAVNVRITNRTPRTYRFTVAEVELQSQSGDRVGPIGAAALAGQLDAAQLEAAGAKLISDRDIAPNETATGYLVFPFHTYVRARVVLTDRSSDEPEGFSIEF
jgi:hypothetical protein